MTEVEVLQEILMALKVIVWMGGAGLGLAIANIISRVILRHM